MPFRSEDMAQLPMSSETTLRDHPLESLVLEPIAMNSNLKHHLLVGVILQGTRQLSTRGSGSVVDRSDKRSLNGDHCPGGTLSSGGGWLRALVKKAIAKFQMVLGLI